jgi:hypothetical protein
MLNNAQPTFAEVARIIAKGEPPEWLVESLEYFSGTVAPTAEGWWSAPTDGVREFKDELERIHKASEMLLRLLSVYKIRPENLHIPEGTQLPDDDAQFLTDVTAVLEALPRIKERLKKTVEVEPSLQERMGRKPNIHRENCAAIVAEASRLCHGHVGARMEGVQQACNEYWRACGNKEIGKEGAIENWRPYLEKALAADKRWIRRELAKRRAVQNSH